MRIPETYEDFLKISHEDWKKIAELDLPLETASKLMQFFVKFSDEIKLKHIVIESKENAKTLGELLNGSVH